MRLELRNIDVDCIVGDLPEERVRTQRLMIDVALEIPDTAATSDRLSDTVDYAALTARIRAALVSAECRMIERAAKIVCDVCRADKRVSAVEATVTKSGSVPHLGAAVVTLRT